MEQAVYSAQSTGPQDTSERAIWLRWVFGHTLVFGAVLVFGGAFTWLTLGFGGLLVAPALLAAPLVAQWIGIHRELQSTREILLWLGATAAVLGMYVCLIVILVVAGWDLSIGISPAGILVLGAMLGLAQSMILQRYISGAKWWVPANAISMLAGVLAAIPMGQYVEASCRSGMRIGDDTGSTSHMMATFFCQLLSSALASITAIMVFSLITGTVLVRLLRQKKRPVHTVRRIRRSR